jgi:hypothetical protein
MSEAGGIASPIQGRNHSDPGDETQRNFRYQHAYGVILLIAAARGHLPYASLWCEHHEDFLAERQDGYYDAYQIKTATPESGAWTWSREALLHSIKRFVELHVKFPGRIAAFCFTSNVPALDSHADKEKRRSPHRLLEALAGSGPLPDPLQEALETLVKHCRCEEAGLRYVLQRLKFQKGPGRDSFDDEIAHTHLSSLEACRLMTAAERTQCLDRLVQIVHLASSLAVRDPSRHWCAVVGDDRTDPVLRAKRIDVRVVRELLAEMATNPFRYVTTARQLPLGDGMGKMSALQQKLFRGGLTEYVDTMRDRALSAERHLMELANLKPDEITRILNQIVAVVKGECDEARLEASQGGEPYGPGMLIDVHDRLRRVATERSGMVYQLPYEVLAGVAGLLTEDCQVWWSARFQVEESA